MASHVLGGAGQILDDETVRAYVAERLAAADLDGRSVCVVVPDATRSCPLPLLLSAAHATDPDTLVVPQAGEVLFRLR